MKRILLTILIALMWALPVQAMIILDDTDVLEAWSGTDAKVDCTIHGLVGSTFTNLYTGTLGDGANTVVYTAGAAISVVSATFTNTDTSAATVNFKLDPANGGNDKFLMPIISLGAGYSAFFDGQRCTVMDASGAIQHSFIAHKDTHDPNDGSDPVDTAAAAAIAGVQAAGVGTSHSLARSDHAHAIAHSIADNALVTVDQADAADDDYAKFTADGLEGRSASETFGDVKQAATTSATGVMEIATNAEVAAFTDETRAVTPEGLGYAMAGLLAYGVSWDEDESSPTLTRTGALAGIAAGSSPGNACLPIQTAMRRCILSDAGVVQYYLCATDSTDKEDCSTASVLDGTDGQVMVEIPKFAYKYTYVAATNVHSWSISSVLLSGYEWHPAFYKDGAWVDHRYVGAYEGIGYDDSAAAYIDHGNVAATGWSGGAIEIGADKLSSVSGKNPVTDETRDEFRTLALNRGAGWRQQDFYLTSAVQLLYLTEYASFYSQDMIGEGRTQLSGGTWVNGSYISEGGLSNGDGNATNSVDWEGDADDATAETVYMTYRGIENFYGNIWKWIDGININGNIPYVCNTETDFADDTATAYTRLTDTGGSGITLHNGDGYQTTLEQTKGGFLPSAVGGSSSTYITDYYYQSTGWRVVKFGGSASLGSYAGAFYVYANYASSVGGAHLGGRLCY